MSKIADPLRSFIAASIAYDLSAGVESFDEHAMHEIMKGLNDTADRIDAEHARRMEQCRRGVRKDFARYMRSCIEDYVKGVSRRNRNHAHAKVSHRKIGNVEHVIAHCTNCGRVISDLANYCCWCGAKVTAREYAGVDDD